MTQKLVSAGLKNQYHHYIPRFILRQFMEVPLPMNKRQRTLSFRKACKTGEDPECIYFYDLSTGVLQSKPISKAYGQNNLYRDMKDPVNVDHLEEMLSRLEQEASFVIHRIRSGIQAHSFTISRKELATLRKFLFLMHYRNDAVSSIYFQENHPNNAPLADWIRSYKKSRQLKDNIDVWLDGLRYYLERPHHAIVATGERLRERYGNNRIHEMLRRRLDPDIDDWYAIDYESQANYFFLGVWEAADKAEFVLGGNGFGLWEGLIYGSPGAHRLYVMSPRIAIILRRTFLHQPLSKDPSILYSCLADIPILPPDVKFADESILVGLEEMDPVISKDIFDTYRASPRSLDDQFQFKITKLTTEQTYAVNEVVMMNANLHPQGSLTFASPSSMLETLQAYMSSHNTFLGGKRSLFKPLLRELSTPSSSVSPTTTVPSLDAPWDVDTYGDLQLHMFLRFIVTGGVTFPSAYNRAYLVFHMATDIPSLRNPVSSKIRSMAQKCVSRLISFLDPPLPPLLPMSTTSKSLVETLPQSESEVFFALLGHQVDILRSAVNQMIC
ncbi:hypothetical protein CPB84DRAFT_1848564 [Gymnopilus junonius]|uniref:DUF4238 domain-containing protein n=1 Tax=Gymnopilus junonius TaxID=109634 RepID=A0A9P5NK16_GYMJU|nr:hypothetical protein CPB84DRAFT_1848564 [Gymnopilus junonius]